MFWEILATLVEAFLVTRFFFSSFELRKNSYGKVKYIGMFIMQALYTFVLNGITSYEGLFVFMHTVYSFILCVILFKNKLFEIASISLISDGIILLVNICVTIVFANEISFSQELGFEQDVLRVMLLTITKMGYFVVTTVIIYMRKKQRFFYNVWEAIGITVVFVISVIIGIFTYDVALNEVGGNYRESIIITYIALFVLNVLTYWLFNTVGKVNRKKNEQYLDNVILHHQIETYRNINEIYDETMSVRHELTNILMGIKVLLSEERHEEAEDKIQNLLGQDIFNVEKVVFTGSKMVDMIVNSRLRKCKESGIPVKINIYGKISQYDEDDMCIIFSNLLDNAIEATIKTTEPYIEVLCKEDAGYYCVFIKNTAILEDTAERTSKIENPLRHGFGMKNVKRIAEKYGGDMINRNIGKYYAVQVLLKL